jgi:hypothetical protein
MESIPTDSDPADEDLLGRLSSDPAAFEVFYRRHVDRVVGFAARSYDPQRGEPGAWLLGITARLIANAPVRLCWPRASWASAPRRSGCGCPALAGRWTRRSPPKLRAAPTSTGKNRAPPCGTPT